MTPAKLILRRKPFRKGQPTQGQLFVSDRGRVVDLRIDTLELEWRNNEARKSCIPAGTYRMEWTFSPKFKRKTWELSGVPGRGDIRIHAGNYAGTVVSDSLGCILPCMDYADLNKDGVIDGVSSGIALKQLEAVLLPWQDRCLDIEVRNG